MPQRLRFLAGGGEMGSRIRDHDWSVTPLGPLQQWPSALKTTLRTVLTTRHPMAIFWGPQHLCLYNDAYSASLGPEKHPGIIGAPGCVAWPETWPIIGPQIKGVMAGKEATWHENRLVPIIRHGGLQEVYWTSSFGPVHDETSPNGIGGVLLVCTETTGQVLAEAALRESEARWRTLFEAMHEGFVICEMVRDADGTAVDLRYLAANAAVERLTGLAPERILGHLASVAIPGLERHWIEAFAKVAETGEPVQAEYRAEPLHLWLEISLCRIGPDRVGALFLNITERRAAVERQAFLAREVDHRAKNALAVVLAAMQLTKAPDISSYVQAVTGRVKALARAQTLLAEDRWTGADLHTLLRGELEGFLSGEAAGGPRATLTGPRVALPAGAAQPLAMAAHELATNATKYGALSVAAGRVEVSWWLHGGPARTLRLRWAETGGPPVLDVPARSGFGSRVLDRAVRGQLGGDVSLAWQATGLVCEIVVPLAAMNSVSPAELGLD